ncbi:MAG: hypothetical protein WCV72_02495 [Patescibacteria group bacterium]|jgi:hypothetical protein
MTKETLSKRPALTLDSIRRTVQMNETTIAQLRNNSRNSVVKPELQIGDDDGFASFEDNFARDVGALMIIEQRQTANQKLRELAREEFGETI